MAESTEPKQRGQGRPFLPGVSGNPAGRPRGSRNKSTLAAMALLDGEAERLSRRAIELALEGDTAALKLCLDKVAPPRRDRPIEIDLRRIEGAADACKALTDLIEAVAAGELSPGEADGLATLIERRVKLAELHEFEQRLRALEERVV